MINETKKWFFENTNKVGKLLAECPRKESQTTLKIKTRI
jgi:hypothetical protein